MLRRPKCPLHVRLGYLILAPRSRCVPQCAGLAPSLSQPKLERHFVQCATRFVSAQRESADQTDHSKNRLATTDDDYKGQWQSLDDRTNTRDKNDGEATFTITPRFQWNYRWSYPKSDDSVKDIRNRNGFKTNKRQPPMDQGSGHFQPTRSDEESNELKSIMGSLDTMAEDLRIPLSPLERRMGSQKWEPKRQPTKAERQKLSFNPWAVMLAGNMRVDAASKIRFPEPFLLEMAPVCSPVDGSNYMVPDDLANLEAFDKRLQRGLRRLAMINLHRERGGGTVKILPDKTLLEELTDTFVTWDDSTKSGRTKAGSVMKRLLPSRWMERAQQINAYQGASREYWDIKQKQGELDDPVFQKPEPPPDMITLKWQPNIVGRIQSIMRQRLLLSIDHLGRKTDQPHNITRNHFMCFQWPQSLYLDVASKVAVTLSDQKGQLDNADARHNPPQHYTTPFEDDVPNGEGSVLRTWRTTPSTYHFSDIDVWLPGSYFLHIGPPETTFTALPYLQQPDSAPTDPRTVQSNANKFIPPMLSVSNNYRLPVFNLQALLGSDFDHTLHQILLQHKMVLSKSDESADGNYLILIRGTAPGSHYIIQEMWQLWRFLGGTDCLQPKVTQVAEPSSKAVTKHQERMNAMKGYSMSQKAWDQFYEFLPGIERKPLDT